MSNKENRPELESPVGEINLIGDSDLDNLVRIFNDFQIEREIINEIQDWITNFKDQAFVFILFDVDNSAILRSVSIELKIKILTELLSLVRCIASEHTVIIGHGTRDDIAILLPAPLHDVRNFALQEANRFRIGIQKHKFGRKIGNTGHLMVSVSGGVSIYPSDSNSAQEIFLLAEGACRLAKESGRNRCELAPPDLTYPLETSIQRERFDNLMDLSLFTGKTIKTLVREAIQLVLQRHAGLERFSREIDIKNS